ncbi:hypothetical protein [Pseudomonas entomophila]|uniref:Uncharacterized protein n=2 Tax=Pseudomonas entomophila TaxID=312306 RepID=Q1IBB0_PSEE4|nr:hypothetical protein [Pseudomonas entomophila]WMW04162.1 hypothetical protein RAH46_17715 [Pseudomonas entomophila]CAK15056.1 hypothetical protein PSEEN2237 [Pseudomonas entomophila L48]
MTEVTLDMRQQALVALIAAAQEQGLHSKNLVDRASELLNSPEGKVRFIPERDVGDVELELSLAYARFMTIL